MDYLNALRAELMLMPRLWLRVSVAAALDFGRPAFERNHFQKFVTQSTHISAEIPGRSNRGLRFGCDGILARTGSWGQPQVASWMNTVQGLRNLGGYLWRVLLDVFLGAGKWHGQIGGMFWRRARLRSGCAGFSVFGVQFSENRSRPQLAPSALGRTW